MTLCDRARGLLERAHAGTLTCDVSDLTHPDAVAIEALARLQLTASRLGRRIEVRGACEQLRLLLNLAGLCDVIALADASVVEALGQPEEREQVRRV
ncbi:MAG: STAS domain-containing protein, partial [Actinobacteria bacterium]|nr:STAS domain-containing protein [Actinomycetota bacterium]